MFQRQRYTGSSFAPQRVWKRASELQKETEESVLPLPYVEYTAYPSDDLETFLLHLLEERKALPEGSPPKVRAIDVRLGERAPRYMPQLFAEAFAAIDKYVAFQESAAEERDVRLPLYLYEHCLRCIVSLASQKELETMRSSVGESEGPLSVWFSPLVKKEPTDRQKRKRLSRSRRETKRKRGRRAS